MDTLLEAVVGGFDADLIESSKEILLVAVLVVANYGSYQKQEV